MTQTFINGLELAERFYGDGVRPILETHYPQMPYSAALLGAGSEVLGFDTPLSRDHDWGPRLMLFLNPTDFAAVGRELHERLKVELPPEIAGYSTNFGANEDGTGRLVSAENTPINHRVKIMTTEAFCRYVVGFNPLEPMTAADWVATSDYNLLMLTAGRVFHDGLGQLNAIREKLAYYPHDVWRYLLACQWQRIAEEEAFMGRCGDVGDEIGSRLVAGRLVKDIMRLCFLLERTYAPYIKWFGSAFANLDCAGTLSPLLTAIHQANDWQERQKHLAAAYTFVAKMQNDLAVTAPQSPEVTPFFSRPYLVIYGGRFADALRAEIKDEAVLAFDHNLGSVDQFLDSTAALTQLPKFKSLFTGESL